MTSNYIKLALLKYFRFNRQMLCATEVMLGYGKGMIADFMAINSTSYEIEIKISKDDFKRDFINKRAKHIFYNHPNRANRFYFAFSKDIHDELFKLVPNNYGVIKIYEDGIYNVQITRQAPIINKEANNNNIRDKIIMRLNSEVIGLRERLLER